MSMKRYLDLKYHSTDVGFTRVKYTDGRSKFCFQNQGYGGTIFMTLFRCSQDWEPDYEVPLNEISKIDQPKGSTSFDLAVNKIILKLKLPS